MSHFHLVQEFLQMFSDSFYICYQFHYIYTINMYMFNTEKTTHMIHQSWKQIYDTDITQKVQSLSIIYNSKYKYLHVLVIN